MESGDGIRTAEWSTTLSNWSAMIISEGDRTKTLGYLTEHIGDSRILQRLGRDVLVSECDSISIATARPLSSDAKYGASVGGGAKSSEAWLTQQVMSYLQSTPTALVLFEDFNSSPSDSYLRTRAHPPFWYFEDRLFWPVAPSLISDQHVRRVANWAASMREAAFFTTHPLGLIPTYKTRSLSPEEFDYMAIHVQVIVIDIFDGEGYLKWHRRCTI